VLRDKFGKLRSIRKKGAIDLVTEADISSEKRLLKQFPKRFPITPFLQRRMDPVQAQVASG
jgi:fructose-1,6-bisphosphatase/inositol monophosphatase family enzyme